MLWVLVYPGLFLVAVSVALMLAGMELPKRDEVVLGIGSWGEVWRSALVIVGYYVEWTWLSFLYPGSWVVHAVTGWPMDEWQARVPGTVLSWLLFVKLNKRALRRMIWWFDPFASAKKGSLHAVWQPILQLRDWWEIVRKFGLEPTAKWASLFEVLTHDYVAGDIFVGRPWTIFGGMKTAIGIRTEKHMVTIAGTGSGKSTAALIPNLCTYPGSVLVIDPKGELARITASRRSYGGNGVDGMDQRLAVLDPYDVTGFEESSSYNPFDELEALAKEDADAAVSFSWKIAEALVRPMSPDPYWDNAPKTLIGGLVLYIFVHEEKEKRNLVHLRYLLMNGDIEGYEDGLKKGTIKKGDVTSFDCLMERMKQARKGLYGEVIAGAATSVTTMSQNQLGSVVTMAQEHTTFLDNPKIQKVCKRSNFLLRQLKEERLSVFVCLPLNAVSGPDSRWLRLFVMLSIDVLTRTKGWMMHPVLLAIDEFPNLGRLDGIEAVAPTMRSYGVRLWVIGQDIAQFKHVYPDTWTGFIGGAEAVQFMGLNHPATLDFLVDLLGLHEVTRQTGQGVRTEARALLDREQLGRFLDKDKQNEIVWFGRKRPMRLKIAPYYEYLPPWYHSPDWRFKEGFVRRLYRMLGQGDQRPSPWMFIDTFTPPPPPPGSGSLDDERADAKYKAELAKLNELYGRGEGPTEKRWRPVEEEPMRGKPGSALAELERVKFQSRMKEEIQTLADLVDLQKQREKEKMPTIVLSYHMVFTGNPGTGKTTVARIVGKFFKEIGILKSGHVVEVERADLVGEYIGHTAVKVKNVIDRALDGLLFIDEAYSLVPEDSGKDFGAEAVATLVKAMEDHRDRLVVIVAGYEDEMDRFIRSNPGLKSRFKNVIHFEDYDPIAVATIYTDMCEQVGCRVSMEAGAKVIDILEPKWELYKKDKAAGWGSGRLARNLFEESIKRLARRVKKQKKVNIKVIEEADVPDQI